MEERGLQDVERWKDKIEVRLDNKQVFFLFFGSALVACLLFVLGVVVGKRLESRGRAQAPEIEDPLALLDRISADPGANDEGLTFPNALIRGGQAPAPAQPAPKHLGKKKEAPRKRQEATRPSPSQQGADPSSEAVAMTTESTTESTTDAREKARDVVAGGNSAGTRNSNSQQKSVAPETVGSPPVEAKQVEKPPLQANPKTQAAPNETAERAPVTGGFSLQIASFKTPSEAQALAQTYSEVGAFVVASELPGKGTWYRVRFGAYPSNTEAMAAKRRFERKHKKIVYLVPR